MSDLFDDLDFEMLGGDFEDPFENEPVDPVPPPVPGMPNAGHQPMQHPEAAAQKASEASCTDDPAQQPISDPPLQACVESLANTEVQVAKTDGNAIDIADCQDAALHQASSKKTPTLNMMVSLADQTEAAAAQQDTRTLMELPPVFKYGSCEEDIFDGDMTFEQLRAEKEPDFLELEDSKRVSWTVQYGRVTKPISSPAKQKIAQVKEEIELSKEFLEGLKKAKDKRPRCFVKPTVAGKSKGIAAYKAILLSPEDAAQSPKPICLFPARDGQMYEMRKNKLGVFVTPTNHIHELSEVRAGFQPALPRIPHELFKRILAFFRYYTEQEHPLEVMVQIYWDSLKKRFLVVVPYQHVSGVEIRVPEEQPGQLDEERFYYYADVHSHNIMPAFFSEQDNRDELATRLYIVNLLDPCCGEGLALERIAQGQNCHTFGVELDDSRARQACEHLERVAMGSYFYSRISHNAFQLLYLNPPYLSTIGANGTRTREERRFLIETIPHLAEHGVLIYIIPYYRLTPDIARVLCDNFEKLSVYRFCGKEFTKFHQIAVLGCRIPRKDGSRLAPAFLSRVEILEQIPTLDELPPESYALPPATAKVQIFYGSVFNEVELARQLESSALCKKLYREENVLDRMDKQPLLPLKVGQVGLIAGSGMVNGYAGGEAPHVIKGYMQPEETITVTSAPQQDPNASQMMYQHNKKSNHLRINILTPHGIKSLS